MLLPFNIYETNLNPLGVYRLKKSIVDSIEKVGITQCPKKRIEFSTLLSSKEILQLPENLPHIKEILSIIVEPEILSQKAVSTIEGFSAEGQYLSGKKIVLQIKFRQKILYISNTTEETIHTFEKEYYKSASVVIPQTISGSNPEDLIKEDYLITKIYIQDIVIKKVNGRSIYNNIILFIDTYLIPIPQLCYTIQDDSSNSNIYISYNDGTHNKELTYSNKNIKPLWSPTGLEIAFLSDYNNMKGKYMLYTYSLKKGYIKKITSTNQFQSISSFCWSSKGENIFITGFKKGEKDIYSIDINAQVCRQLTFGKGDILNYKPKCSPDGKFVAFLQSISGISNLCITDTFGSGVTKLTTSGYIKDFDWEPSGNNIIYVSGKTNTYDQIYMLNLMKFEKIPLKIPNNIFTVKKLSFSPDYSFIVFIGSDLITEDLFIYDIHKKQTINLTNNFSKIKINDFVWNRDSTTIYYSANDLQYFNIYSYSFKDHSTSQITSTTASDIRLSYRPKII